MIKLGITGGIGSGKSYVACLLTKQGIPIYDCDKEAKRLTLCNDNIRKKLIKLLGATVYSQNGELNKSLLAHYLFALPENAQRVNAIIHPVVKDDFLQWVKAYSHFPLVGMESAILYESGFHFLVDKVLLIDAPESLCLKRAMQRDGATQLQIKARMERQYTNEYKRRYADYVIHNNEEELLEPKIEKLLHALNALYF